MVMHFHIPRLHAQSFSYSVTKPQRILATDPELTLAILHMGRGIHGLHTSVGEVGYAVLSLNNLSRVFKSRAHIALQTVVFPLDASGDVAIKLGKDFVAAHTVTTIVIPLDR